MSSKRRYLKSSVSADNINNKQTCGHCDKPLSKMYQDLYPNATIGSRYFNRSFRKYSSVSFANERFGCQFQARLTQYGYIIASW